MHEITITPAEGLQNTIDRLPDDGTEVFIRLLPGMYREKIEIRRPRTTLMGSGAENTRIVWADAAKSPHADGRITGTFRSYTLLVLAQDCRLAGLTIENAAGPREKSGQCIALFADGDGFLCEDCALLSHQDTLFTAPLPPTEVIPGGFLGPTQFTPRTPQRQTYRRCVIKGDVDFIFGGAAAWFEDCDIVSTGEGYATAASTPESQQYGYVFCDCRFSGEGVPPGSCYLGRPWRVHGKTVLMHCLIGAHIHPAGWHDWGKADFPRYGYFAEFSCTGEGSDQTRRAAFSHALTEAEAAAVTYEDFWRSM